MMVERNPSRGSDFPVDDLVLTVSLACAGVLRVVAEARGAEIPIKLDSLLFLGGLFGLGFSIHALAAGFAGMVKRDRAVLLAMGLVGIAALVVADVERILDRGLAVSTPFAVAVVMGLLGLRRR